MKNVPVSLSFRRLNSSFYPFVGPIPWLYHTLQHFLQLNTLFLLLSSILPADIDLGKKKRTCFDAIKIFIYRLFMEPSRTMISIACVASFSEQRTRNESQRPRFRETHRECGSLFIHPYFDFKIVIHYLHVGLKDFV